MNFTFSQKLAMTSGFIGAATSAFGALGPLLTANEILIGTVIFGFVTACLGVVNTVTSSQAAQIKAVASITGDDGQPAVRVNVKGNASASVAAVAVDPTQPNVGAVDPATRAVLQDTANKGA